MSECQVQHLGGVRSTGLSICNTLGEERSQSFCFLPVSFSFCRSEAEKIKTSVSSFHREGKKKKLRHVVSQQVSAMDADSDNEAEDLSVKPGPVKTRGELSLHVSSHVSFAIFGSTEMHLCGTNSSARFRSVMLSEAVQNGGRKADCVFYHRAHKPNGFCVLAHVTRTC